jgi:methyl-accepting chemotaxis protein
MIAMQETTADNIQQQEKKVFHKRKKLNLKVKQDFQIWLLTRILGTVLLTIGVSSILIYLYAQGQIAADFLNIKKLSEILLPFLLVSSLTSIVAGMLLALFLPQKIAGPIFRIEQDLQKVREGDLTKKVTLRYHDIMKELAEHVNVTVADIRYLLRDIKEVQANLEVKLSDVESEEIKGLLDQQKTNLERFKT